MIMECIIASSEAQASSWQIEENRIESSSVSPIDYGLMTAKTGEERYWALYNAHADAVRLGKKISYQGVGDIQIVIPKDAQWIPLAKENDFSGVTITVENNHKDFALFSMVNKGKVIDIDQSALDGSNFRQYEKLKRGIVLLVLIDENPWVENRKGYNYGASRNDILLLKNGVAQNKTIMPWGDVNTTKPSCQYIVTSKDQKVIKNLTMVRSASSSHKTMIFTIEGQNNVLIDNVSLITPEEDEKYGDRAIGIDNCTNVIIRNLTIQGTYSQSDKFGYGISMNNNWNTRFINLVAEGKWGVFGTNNMNTVTLEDCNVNRFDIHCYGRDVTMKNCYFHDYYNQFSSVYGTIYYEKCTFDKFIPYLNESSYHCYTPFALRIKNCVWNVSKKYGDAAICFMGSDDDEFKNRPELRQIAWPNVIVNGLKINVPEELTECHVFYVSGSASNGKEIVNINRVKIKNVVIKEGVQLKMSNRSFKTVNNIRLVVKKK